MKKISILLISILSVTLLMGQRITDSKLSIETKSKKHIFEIQAAFNPQLLKNTKSKAPLSLRKKMEDKTITDFKMGLDSMEYRVEGMVYYTDYYVYNEQGKCVLFTEYELNSEYEMIPDFRTIYTYYNSGSLKSTENQMWDEELNSWTPYYKSENTYVDGLLSESEIYVWDEEQNEYLLYFKDIYSYNSQDILEALISQIDDNGSWVNSFKTEYFVHGSKYAYKTIYSTWDVTNSAWIPFNKEEDFFNGDGDVEMNLESEWDVVNSEWIDRYKVVYQYNDNHQVISAISSEFFYEFWELYYLDEYSYDDEGNIIEEIFSEWDDVEWIPGEKYEYILNYSYTMEDLLMPIDLRYDLAFVNMPEEQIVSLWDGSWVPDERVVLYYSEKETSGLDHISNTKVNVYPNPNNGIFTVDMTSFDNEILVTILDFAGRVLEQQEVNNESGSNQSFDLSAYSKGVYFMEISDGSKKAYHQLVLQ